MVKDPRGHRETEEIQERQEPTVLRDRLVGLDLEADHLNDLRRVNTILSTPRGTVVALTTEREVPEEAIRTMMTTTTP